MSKVAKKFIAKGPGGEHGREQEHVDGGDKKEKAQRDGDRDGITFKQRELEVPSAPNRLLRQPSTTIACGKLTQMASSVTAA